MMPSSRCVDRSLLCVCACVCVYVCVLCVCVCVSFCANENNVLRRSKIYLIANKEDTVSPVHLRSLIRLIFLVYSVRIRGILKMKTQMVRTISGCFTCIQFAHGVSIFSLPR